MAIFHRTQAPLARLVPEAGGAGALTVDNRILQILNVDYMVWSQDLADHADRITAQARAEFPGARPEAWLTGEVSPRARDELRARGWTVHERGLRLDHSAVAVGMRRERHERRDSRAPAFRVLRARVACRWHSCSRCWPHSVGRRYGGQPGKRPDGSSGAGGP